MLTLLTQLATAAVLWLRIRYLTAAYDLSQRIETDVTGIESSIKALRDRGDPDAQRLADQLRKRLSRAQGIAAAVDANLSAPGAAPLQGRGDQDAGRPLPPANG